ncbi:MAG: hypothetical protein AYK18_12830 [Theionarchaea archaeon DG-70]|nr:MAG: hypothetical protein AYK18_12830 [Theionarchaea archaeon DG-70]
MSPNSLFLLPLFFLLFSFLLGYCSWYGIEINLMCCNVRVDFFNISSSHISYFTNSQQLSEVAKEEYLRWLSGVLPLKFINSL